MTALHPPGLPLFRAVVAARLGLHFDDSRASVLAGALQRRAESAKVDPPEYAERLRADPVFAARELRDMAEELTVGETSFFRHGAQLDALRAVIEELPSASLRGARLRVLSAGCSTGEEAYTIAMVVRDAIQRGAFQDATIRAVDLRAGALASAARGVYPASSLGEAPAEARDRWFRKDGAQLVLDPTIRSMVRFEEKNLADDDRDLFRPRSYDVVFCRNVLMYFTAETAGALVQRIARSLVPGGFLFVGHGEALRGIPHDFQIRYAPGAFFYQKLEQPAEADAAWRWHERRSVDPLESETRVIIAAPLPAPPVDLEDAWRDDVRPAAEEVDALGPGAGPASARAPSPSPSPPLDLEPAIDLLRRERFADALVHLRSLPGGSERDPDVLLLRAVLLTRGGDPRGAEIACMALLELDAANAGARYLLASCREADGDHGGAAEHDRAASYFDPTFAMPRLHLGLMARRAGDAERARDELGRALVLLQREDASRLLLFGGGLDRAALIALCRAELASAGGGA